MMDVETTRASYRPDRIATLFVGESAPASGDFFYFGNNAMLRHMQRATEAVLGQSAGDFLDRFKEYGWFLDDLVLTPVDNLAASERRARCLAAKESLSERIAAYRPLAIVSMLVSIRSIVETAAKAAGSNATLFGVPFPGMGQQACFHNEMLKIIPRLPRSAA
ncbi:hypothetical protein XI09_17185 [Bradyrhizobium sp. CCBAU 11386]|uniref:hypothetical protein n=1 Tax=Bradyrhizobium sp. CCBAU 11386 TaxID=1630837 RepID=UPI0023042A10|nr:hypothetical protein [Bradyrhizobium sp. CCBAU 11386]MDA9506334.1 hypothetical protein [Bradyrhizobium sp. CCBAU 11386]